MSDSQRDDPAVADDEPGRIGRGGRHGPQNCGAPCSNCIKRSCGDICPDGVRPGRKGSLNVLLSSHGIKIQGAVDPPSDTDQSFPGPSVPATMRRPSSLQQPRERSRSPSIPHGKRPFAYNDESLHNTPSGIRMHSPEPLPQFAYQYYDHPTSLITTTESPNEDNLGGMEERSAARHVTQESRAQSPSRSGSRPQHLRSFFPFEGVQSPSISTIITLLPPYEHAQDLLQSYYRYFAWNHRPASESSIQLIFCAAYNTETSATSSRTEYAQKLALLFITFALGALHNLELPPNDPSAEEYCMIAKACLAEGNFMKRPTIMGVQALFRDLFPHGLRWSKLTLGSRSRWVIITWRRKTVVMEIQLGPFED
ncbi:hypothetical protein I204_07507 [Kwoniella mangroviensis CBS 8886]|nr:hypothetical protein I204_07507 [Kwoniella mangroviensis CBS 8886]